MIPTRRGLPLVAAVLLLTAVPARAATLKEAVDAAYRLAAQQPRAEALRREGEAIREQAGSLVAEDPALHVRHQTDRFSNDDGATEWEAMLDLPLWLPGQRHARRSVADAAEREADALTRRLLWETAGEVREAAWDSALAEGRVRQAELALQSAKELEADVQRRAQAGELAAMELLLARQESLGAEAELQSARSAQDRALERYRGLTGLDALPSPLEENMEGGDALPDDHPLLAEAGGGVDRARAERDRTLTEKRASPVLSVGGKRVRDLRDTPSYDALAVEISIPLGLGSQSAPRQASAERTLTDTEAQRRRVLRDAELALAEARLEREGAEQALGVAERQQVLAAETLRLTRRAFDLGETDLTHLLRARRQALDADLALALRRLERGRALARLSQALGRVPE